MRSDLAVVLTKNAGAGSRLIRWITKSEVSHAAIVSDIHGIPVVLHADVGGVQVNSFPQFTRGNQIVFTYPVPKERKTSMNVAVFRIGERYDYAGLLGFFFVFFRLRKRNPFASARATVCSEFVADVLGLDLPPEETTPDDLRKKLDSLGWGDRV